MKGYPIKVQFYSGQAIKAFLIFSSIAIFYLNRASSVFETEFRTDLWSTRFSLLNILVSIIGISISLSLHRPHFTMAFFWVFQFVFFGMGGFLIQLDPFPYYLSLIPSENDLYIASQIILIANLFVLLTEVLTIRRNALEVKFDERIELLNYQILLTRSYRLLLIYALSIPVILNQLGGFLFLFKRIRISQIGDVLPISVNAVLLALLYVPPLIVILILYYVKEKIVTSTWIFRLLFIWVLLLSNPLGNSRQTTLFFLLPLAFFYLNKWPRLSIYFFTLLTLFFVYAAGLVNRYTGQIQMPRLTILSRDGDFDAFTQLANGLKAVSLGVFPIFEQFLGSLLFFVPRSIWIGKPIDTGVEIAQTFSLKFQNLSAPWILEAYANARLYGVIMVSILIGYQLTKLEMGARAHIRSFLISSIISGFLFILLRGSLLQATGRVAFSIVLVFYLLRGLGSLKKSFD